MTLTTEQVHELTEAQKPCALDPESWFPDQGGSAAIARRWCAQCPVSTLCLEYTMTTERGWNRDRRHGVVAGLTGFERWRLAKQQGEEIMPTIDDDDIADERAYKDYLDTLEDDDEDEDDYPGVSLREMDLL